MTPRSEVANVYPVDLANVTLRIIVTVLTRRESSLGRESEAPEVRATRSHDT